MHIKNRWDNIGRKTNILLLGTRSPIEYYPAACVLTWMASKTNARILRGEGGGFALHSMAHELCSDEGAHGNPDLAQSASLCVPSLSAYIVPAMCDFLKCSPLA